MRGRGGYDWNTQRCQCFLGEGRVPWKDVHVNTEEGTWTFDLMV